MTGLQAMLLLCFAIYLLWGGMALVRHPTVVAHWWDRVKFAVMGGVHNHDQSCWRPDDCDGCAEELRRRKDRP